MTNEALSRLRGELRTGGNREGETISTYLADRHSPVIGEYHMGIMGICSARSVPWSCRYGMDCRRRVMAVRIGDAAGS